MGRQLYLLITGYLRLKVTGRRLEKLLNILMRQGFKIWQITKIDDMFYFNVKAKEFVKINHYIKNLGCQVEVKQKIGLPFLWDKLVVRKGLIIGIIILIVIIYTLSSFVWFIEIRGAEIIEEEEIVDLLSKYKVHLGVLKSSISPKKVERLISRNLSGIAWVNVYYQGTRLVIEIVEKDKVDLAMGSSDIIAKKAGMISELIVFKGRPMVKEGMTVKKGDLLISKEVIIRKEEVEDVINEDNEEQKVEVVKKKVKAAGIVKAITWYENYGEARLVRYYEQLTANQESSLIIKYKNKEFIIKGPKKPPYKYFILKEEVKNLSKWRNISFPIEIIRRRYIQVKELREYRSKARAKELAKDKAVEGILELLPKEARILNSQLKLIELKGKDNNIIRVKALVEVEEDIAIRARD